MATQKQQDQDVQEYEAAFNEPDQQTKGQSEDEAFGITPEITSAESGEGDPPVVTISPEEEAETPEQEATEGPAGEAAEEAEPEMNQNQKTWDGRLKKREEELAAREKAIKDMDSGSMSGAEGRQDGGNDEAGEEGKMSSDAAMAKLSEDFGPEFVEMIKVIASGIAQTAASEVASKAVETVGTDVKDIIAHLQDSGQKSHFKAIASVHPDFMDVSESPEFEKWLDSRPEEKQAEDAAILASGGSDEVIALLDEYKAATGMQEDAGEDAAEGVRSGGITLPTKPQAGNDDYEAAWKEA